MARLVNFDCDLVAPEEPALDESELEKLLSDALRGGVITQYDTGRGRALWYNGRPGKRFRALRRQVVVAIGKARAKAGLPQRQI